MLSTPDKLPERSPPRILSCTSAGEKAAALPDQLWAGDSTKGTRPSKKSPSSNSSTATRQTKINFGSGPFKPKKTPETQVPRDRLLQSSLISPTGQGVRTPSLETFQYRSELQLSCEDSPSPPRMTSPAEGDVIVVRPLTEGTKRRGRRQQPASKNKLKSRKRKAKDSLASKAIRQKTTNA